ncbi:hypothetical protein PDN66_04345 [Bacillus cereus]|uniref:Uncharacterized protein n=2 Tax=Bacillus cereus group TaxID=86661 RepID=A0A9W5L3F6_BACCE|nr:MULTISPECIES: hypothetical protein [Bacillus cereus group]EEM47268.1 Sucrase [Bacillus thuringiensis serovar pakistani str. T13001]EJR76026.1 hypothetical protein IK5_00989 [Bacillus cereus VD154]KIU75504.1 6-aminohexanoate-dimer hydrolase [Bacillus thuringiensis Sbt003]MDA2254261.1 hypothetical protein [Bacillus cereus]MDA2504282.1 hypothetical protein [Bacillus cereus]
MSEGKEILSKSWLKVSTEMIQNQYGYLCWLREVEGVYLYCEMGEGRNMNCCVPEKER